MHALFAVGDLPFLKGIAPNQKWLLCALPIGVGGRS